MMKRAEKWPVIWVLMRSSHCPYLVRIESNADFLRFYGGLLTQPYTDCVTTKSKSLELYMVAWQRLAKGFAAIEAFLMSVTHLEVHSAAHLK